MDRGNIPGYYFDSEKRKYFKITPNHVATPANQYSKESVKRADNESAKLRARARYEKAVNEQLVKPAVILKSPLVAGIGLQREMSQRTSSTKTLDTRAKAYAAGLELDWAIPTRPGISTFTHDPATGDFLAGSKCDQGHFAVNVYSTVLGREPEFLEIFSSEISSISLSPSGVAAVTSLGDTVTAKVAFMTLTEPEFTIGRSIDYQMSVGFSFSAETTAWTSAANPFFKDQSSFAIGLSDRVVLFTDAEGDWVGSEDLPSTSDVFALDWLTPNLVSVGHRNGSVKLWDMRSKGSSLRLQHPSCITGIRRVNAESLVICGRQNSLAMYDLRMPLTTDTPSPNKRRKKASRSHNNTMDVTTPVIRFDHENECSERLGFDIDTDKSLVAAGNERGGVDLYSLLTGDKVQKQQNLAQSLKGLMRRSTTDQPTGLVKTLQFCKDDNRSGDCLIGSTGDSMFRMTW